MTRAELNKPARENPSPTPGVTPAARKTRKVREFASVDHLSPEAVAAFVDEELSRAAMHRARVHLVHCKDCRCEVETQRRAAERLRSLTSSDSICAPSSLLDRLNSIAQSCPAGPSAEESAYAEPATLLDRVDLFYRAVRRTQRRL